MKLNNKGFAISSIMYIILVLGVILISLIFATLSSRKLVLDKLQNEVLDNIYGENVRLPNEYQQVEYIENSGTQYIDARFIPNNNTTIDIVFETNNIGDFSQYITGAREVNESNKYEGIIIYALSGSRSTNGWTVTINDNYPFGDIDRTSNKVRSIVSISTKESRWILKDLTNNTILYNNKATDVVIPSTSVTMHIFAFNYQCIHEGLKLYSYKAYQNGELIRNFIPCYRKSDGIIGLYDAVEKRFYTNSGSGNFEKGNDI